ncbi:acyl-CoA dehydrogenase family protein [Streptomyces albireticuli]|uniref:Oxidoreductase n=1 Tax=Streptomyces albireticuli TaxID=1940 RepID=A0A2A2CZP0_9ACTN|nr:acyl-CoA dehydrogenase family protein [Streptomyces albireticuli]MCD9140805.1 acyl-CoA/acyl-ACP dehydrogenase [Streptomyces albireticuli]MCD9161233.1 acyl-CoA/acyl-ACP dehydrogenase [Streptomyces albireticuli]MCD9190709.1 acyl-CoA/acyl-ACP dehydrogenase [Streptomyces albireticuli]PAU44677.1 oxidoreductase [Streptomyces albireticuli]
MRFLARERAALDSLLPGLDKELAGRPLGELERPGNPGVKAFREAGGAGLLVPAAHGGKGADALAAVRVQRAIGSRSPSLAVATTMHHFSLASLVALSETGNGFEWMLLTGVVNGNLLLASGFAEGQPNGSILRPTMSARITEAGVVMNGAKRPCSLARSMDLLTASVMVPREDGRGEQLAVVLIPAESPGLTVSPFWGSFALAGAESDQVTVTDVLVPHDLVVRTEVPEGEVLDDIQTTGFVWFELLMTASYLGAASALVERLVGNERVPDLERVRLVGELEAAVAAVENVARQTGAALCGQELLVDSLHVRYAAQDTLARVVPRAVELLGGLNFMSSDDIGYLAAAVHGLGLHPPARAKMAAPLARYLAGHSLEIV